MTKATELRSVAELCVLAALSTGPRDAARHYVTEHYGVVRGIASKAVQNLADGGYVTQKLVYRKGYRVELSPEGIQLGHEQFAIVSRYIDQPEDVELEETQPPLSEIPRSARRAVFSPQEWRLLLTLLKNGESYAGTITEQAEVARATLGRYEKSGFVAVVRHVSRHDHIDERATFVYDLTEKGRKRALAALAWGRRLYADWQAGQAT